jgi:hypothetical protein
VFLTRRKIPFDPPAIQVSKMQCKVKGTHVSSLHVLHRCKATLRHYPPPHIPQHPFPYSEIEIILGSLSKSAITPTSTHNGNHLIEIISRLDKLWSTWPSSPFQLPSIPIPTLRDRIILPPQVPIDQVGSDRRVNVASQDLYTW